MAIEKFPAQRRTVTGKKVAKLRREGQLPGIVYGPVVKDTVPVIVDSRTFLRFYQAHGHATLFDLTWEDGRESVFIREVQFDPVRRDPLHVDFFAPNLRMPIRAMVPIVLHNVSGSSQAILTELRTDVEVEALPALIPAQIDVDVAGLEQPGDAVHVRDLVLPENVVAITDGDEIIAHMIALAAAEEPAEEAEPSDEGNAEAAPEE